MKKKYLYLLVVLSFVFCLVGCGNNITGANTTTANPTTTTQSITTNEVTTNITTTTEHEYGAMYYALEATFLRDGNIAYYQCSHCNKYFDEDYNEVESVVVPKLSNELSLYINGDYVKDFTLEEEDDNHLLWSIDLTNLKKDNVITIRLKNDSNHIFDFFVGSNSLIDEEGTIHNDADSSHIDLYYNANGLHLSSTGFEYEGITIIKNTDEYPMNYVEYNFGIETKSYIYGYLVLNQNDVIEVYDHDNNVSYGYSCVSEDDLWNTPLFSESTDHKILINKDARVGIEFDTTTKTIYIDAVYNPNNGSSYSVDVNGESSNSMTKTVYEKTSNEYKSYTYVITNEKTINNYDIVTVLEQNGLVVYNVTVDLKANDKIRIKNDTNNTYVKSDHLLDLYGFRDVLTAVEFDGEYVKVLESGKYSIMYMDCVDGFIITYMGSSVTPTATVQLNISSANPDAGLEKLIQSESNPNVYEIKNKELLVSDVFSILYNGTNYSYSDIEEGQDLVTSIASQGYSFLMPKVAGTYDISFNVQTLKISLVLVEEKTVNVLVSCKLYDSKNLNVMTLDGEEFKYTLTVSPGMYFGFIDQDSNSVDDFVLSEPYDTSVVMMLAGMIYIIGDANVTVYIHRTTHVVRLVINQ